MNLKDDTLTIDSMNLARVRIGDIPVMINPYIEPIAKIQIDPNFKWCSDEFRAKMNAWLKETFGTEEVAYMIDMDAIGISGGKRIMMNPKMAMLLKL